MESDEAECARGPDTVLSVGNEAVGSPGAKLGSPGRGLAPNSGVVSPPSGNNTTTAGEINAKVKYLFIYSLNYSLWKLLCLLIVTCDIEMYPF